MRHVGPVCIASAKGRGRRRIRPAHRPRRGGPRPQAPDAADNSAGGAGDAGGWDEERLTAEDLDREEAESDEEWERKMRVLVSRGEQC